MGRLGVTQPRTLARSIAESHKPLSDQVTTDQIEVVLTELERVLSAAIPGEIVELGCYVGTTSMFVRRLLDARKENRAFHVYDSFQGLPEKSAQDTSSVGEAFAVGELAVSKKQFMQTFARAGLVAPIVHKAWFKELTPSDIPENIAFAFLDGDFYESIRDSLKLVVPRMTKGGTIVVDDYAREALPGAAKAVHEYFSSDVVRTSHNMGIIRL